MTVVALILAGGHAKRMGGLEKAWQSLHGQPMLQHVIDRLQPQVDRIMINANRDLPRYQSLGYPVVRDADNDARGPLAGILSAFSAITHESLLVVPCDMPYLPHDVSVRLLAACTDPTTQVAMAHDGERLQPLVVLLKPPVRQAIATYTAAGGRRVDECWLAQSHVQVFFNDPAAFTNINTLDELNRWEQSHD